MGERDLGSKTSMMRDRAEHAPRRGEPLGDASDADGTAEELERAVADVHADADLEEAKAEDQRDVPADDYVQDDSAYRGVVDPDAVEHADERARRDAAPPRPRE